MDSESFLEKLGQKAKEQHALCSCKRHLQSVLTGPNTEAHSTEARERPCGSRPDYLQVDPGFTMTQGSTLLGLREIVQKSVTGLFS